MTKFIIEKNSIFFEKNVDVFLGGKNYFPFFEYNYKLNREGEKERVEREIRKSIKMMKVMEKMGKKYGCKIENSAGNKIEATSILPWAARWTSLA